MLRDELPWAERRKRRQRQVVCWYDRMALKATSSGADNLAVVRRHLAALARDAALQVPAL